jgi:uncharacterized membrane protein
VSDPAIVLAGVLAALPIALVLGVAFARRARRRRARASEERRTMPESGQDVARWVDEGRWLFSLWQERIERLDELQRRLAEMADEIGHLRAEASRIDELRADVARLGREAERLRAEGDDLREVLG